MISKRLLPLVMALVISAAPLALELCQIECGAPAPAAVEHSCHEQAHAPAPVDSPQVGALPHICGHEGGLPASSPTSGFVLAQAVMAQVPALSPGSASRLSVPAVVLTRVPIPPPLLTPLRL